MKKIKSLLVSLSSLSLLVTPLTVISCFNTDPEKASKNITISAEENTLKNKSGHDVVPADIKIAGFSEANFTCTVSSILPSEDGTKVTVVVTIVSKKNEKSFDVKLELSGFKQETKAATSIESTGKSTPELKAPGNNNGKKYTYDSNLKIDPKAQTIEILEKNLKDALKDKKKIYFDHNDKSFKAQKAKPLFKIPTFDAIQVANKETPEKSYMKDGEQKWSANTDFQFTTDNDELTFEFRLFKYEKGGGQFSEETYKIKIQLK
ncbi:hypothetical protein PT313_02905 [Metamycoplasma hyosynoviae]|uniref:Lipoprotein-associated type-17 domain-containing protein n=1 Tax=Metamycoplasma hyosynoviae TaxID=29559 RepID=A0A9Q9BQ12_9BACT|nr:hypothetical protein [Metamycoplasma hyosynoviae]MDC8911929.1 hypothetical protein [Metamycoplasma hyosynoviae]MDC8917838.1 hypothetical protein [Metamycoplasma hyosynoviae]MDC8918670.1 hypothetical protein [Metamycoplasma hyosynoviae]MDC8919153.1 hypothetical protein [Metamycoplasma hyosynoviae]MDC8937080.1 hypothetical protein [Metamycoplasma hyosynoviae]